MQDTYEQPELDGAQLRELAERWITRIKQRQDETAWKEWRREAENAEKVYLGKSGEGDETGEYSFNMLFANVETVTPAIYNSTAIPDLRPMVPRSSDQFKTLTEAGKVHEAVIESMTDDNALDAEIEAAAKSAYIAGRGIVRVRFDADEIERVEVYEQTDPNTGMMARFQETVIDYVNERVRYEVVPWRDYVEGSALRWSEVPWIAFRLIVPPDGTNRFDDDYIKAQEPEGGYEDDSGDCVVWEIWDKGAGKVLFVREKDQVILREIDDPLGLRGFFPIPKPVDPISVAGRRCPVAPFTIYKDLAEEVERCTRRICGITKGLRVRGGVAGDAQDIADIAEAGDNELVPIQNVEGLAAAGGLEGAIVWWPVDKAITVLRELYGAREQAKQQIYEITGISDIVRGASKASETAHAQEIKSQWGSLRIRKMQTQIQRLCRDLFVMTTEIASANFRPERFAELSGREITPEVMAILEQPLDQFRIDVESDSTVRGDLQRMRGEMAQFLQGTAQYMQTMTPIVQAAGAEAAVPMVQLYAAFARTHNLGRQGEDALDALITMAEQASQQSGQDDPQQQMAQQMAMMEKRLEVAKMEAEVEKMRADTALSQRSQALDESKHQLDVAKAQVDARQSQERLDMDGIKAAAEIELETDQERPVGIE